MADGRRSVCIVGGCGHVGLPLGVALSLAGAQVTLLDVDRCRVDAVAQGRMPFLEEGADELLPQALASGRLTATTSTGVVRRHDAVIVTLGTPLDEFLNPSVAEFDRALDELLALMTDRQLLILRSTVFPGVTDRLAHRTAERGPRIDIAYCPERIAQGYALRELATLPQIVGGTSPLANRRACDLFGLLGVKLVELPPVEAELSKLFANAYRYINFAISNQFYTMADKFGADFARIHRAITEDYPRMASFAKAGFAAGPCLFKDTMQLAAFNHSAFTLGQAAMTVNEGLPSMLVDTAKRDVGLAGKTAAILGMAFKGNSDDCRSSLAYKLRKLLTLECRKVLCTDPFIDDPEFVSLEQALAQADVAFLGACHEEYRNLQSSVPVIDVFDFLPTGPRAARRAA
jgi:UDP-N-acetyl-D-mannosaminuronic acid dehydrogenase